MLSVRADSPAGHFCLFLVALFSIGPLAVAGQNNTTKPGSWSGILVSSSCNADEAFAESPECTKNMPGARLALYNDTNRVMYGLEPQEHRFHRDDVDWARGRKEGARFFGSRPVWPGTNSRNAERSKRHRSSFFPLRGLVTVL